MEVPEQALCGILVSFGIVVEDTVYLYSGTSLLQTAADYLYMHVVYIHVHNSWHLQQCLD